MSDAQTAENVATPAKKAREVTVVEMTDGRSVEFVGKKRMDKEVIIDGNEVSVRFDFKNGQTRTILAGTLDPSIQLQAIGHGLSQKIGDETAGEEDVDDMVVAVDSIIDRLGNGSWTAPRAAGSGDSFSGASIVIKALAEVTGKSAEDIKAFLQAKLDKAAAAGEKLTRAALYASFRVPGTKTAPVIERLEAEKRAKAGGAVNADDLLTELG